MSEIFDKVYTNEEIGKVVNSVEIESNKLLDIAEAAGEYTMFYISDGEIRA